MTDKIIEIFGVISALLYVVLEIKQKWSMWIIGIISSLVYVYVFFIAKFYADAVLNIYYALASIYGMWCWRKRTINKSNATALAVTHITPKQILIFSLIALGLLAIMRYVLIAYTDSPVPTGDAFITALSIVGTYMLARKILEQWHVWIVVNAVSTGLYFYKDLTPTALLYITYTILSFYGLWRWCKDMRIATTHEHLHA